MKRAILILSALFAVAHAEATSIMLNPLNANITKVRTQPNTALAEKAIYGGSVTIESQNNLIILTLLPSSQCPKGMACAAVMPAPIRLRAELSEISTNSCGSILYSGYGAEDEQGIGFVVTVSDNTHLRCRIALPPTTIKLEFAGFIPEKHLFYASPLN